MPVISSHPSFGLESILLIERGEIALALVYICGSVLFGVGGLWGGLALARAIL